MLDPITVLTLYCTAEPHIAMQMEFADLVRHDYVHTDEFTIVYAMLGVALVMQMVVLVWTMYMTPYEMQRLWPSVQNRVAETSAFVVPEN